MVFISNNQSPEILKPGNEPFDFPTTLITPQLPAILGARFLPALTIGD